MLAAVLITTLHNSLKYLGSISYFIVQDTEAQSLSAPLKQQSLFEGNAGNEELQL